MSGRVRGGELQHCVALAELRHGAKHRVHPGAGVFDKSQVLLCDVKELGQQRAHLPEVVLVTPSEPLVRSRLLLAVVFELPLQHASRDGAERALVPAGDGGNGCQPPPPATEQDAREQRNDKGPIVRTCWCNCPPSGTRSAWGGQRRAWRLARSRALRPGARRPAGAAPSSSAESTVYVTYARVAAICSGAAASCSQRRSDGDGATHCACP